MENKEDNRYITVDTHIPMAVSRNSTSGNLLANDHLKDSNAQANPHAAASTNATTWMRRLLVAVGSSLGIAVITVVFFASSTTSTSVSTITMSQRSSKMDLSSASHDTNLEKQKRLPQCIIIGARKCGTRALLEFMNLHPQVAIASEEIHFFDNDVHYSRGLDWYKSQMPFSSKDQITVEKSPRYFIDEMTPERIHQMNSSIKLILILRDPVTRTVSDFAQIVANRKKRGKQVKRFGRLVINPETKEINTDLRMVTTSMYERHLENWYRHFPRDQIHIVNGDDLVRDPFSQLSKVEDFLGLQHLLRRDQFVYNATKGFYCARKRTGTLCLNKGKGRPHPNVSKRILRKLRRFFRSSNSRLSEMTGQTFSWRTL